MLYMWPLTLLNAIYVASYYLLYMRPLTIIKYICGPILLLIYAASYYYKLYMWPHTTCYICCLLLVLLGGEGGGVAEGGRGRGALGEREKVIRRGVWEKGGERGGGNSHEQIDDKGEAKARRKRESNLKTKKARKEQKKQPEVGR